jgi:hypothetical protein
MTLSITAEAKSHYAEWHYAEGRILFIVMLSVVMLNVVMLSVLAPFLMPHPDRQTQEDIDGGMDRQTKGYMDGLTYKG